MLRSSTIRIRRRLAPVMALLLVCLPVAAEQISANAEGARSGSTGKTAGVRSALLLDLETSDRGLDEVTRKINAVLGALLSSRADLHLIDRDSYVQAIEQAPVSRRLEEKLAFVTGAELILSGRVFALDRDLYIVVRVEGAETGDSFGEMVRVLNNEPPSVAVEQLAGKIGGAIQAQSGRLFSPELGPQELRAVVARSVPDERMPSLRLVEIDDRTDPGLRGREVLSEVLESSGFSLSGDAPAGEGFDLHARISSEDGPRKGDLYSAVARLEVRLTDSGSGLSVFAEREAEMVFAAEAEDARRAALLRAAREIALKMVPAIER